MWQNIFSSIVLSASFLGALAQTNLSDKALNSGWKYWSDQHSDTLIVDLPHDAMQQQERNPAIPGGHASSYFGGDVYHYCKSLTLDKRMAESHVTLHFEGIYRNPVVSINGQQAGGTSYGYIPFDVVADGLLHEGENTIRIDADNSLQPNSRWYSGGGIYRPIHISVQDKETYLEQIRIKTVSIDPSAIISIKTAHRGGEVHTDILLSGKKVAEADGDDVTIRVPDAQLWSAETPVLYEAFTTLSRQGKVVETRRQEFGIRTIAWNGTQGLLVNGVPTLLKGGCLHHDNGLLGACTYDDAEYRKLSIMKQYGFNAIRSAHNPANESLLRAADRLGLYVMDELWDMWYSYKSSEDYSKDFMANWEQDIDALVNRDYNHPSVIMYSIGNEVVEPATAEGQEQERKMVERLHTLDTSRPVTCGMNLIIQMMNAAMGMNMTRSDDSAGSATKQKKMTSEEYNAMAQSSGRRMMQGVLRPQIDSICSPGLDLLDIAGYNYGSLRAELDASLHPNRVQVGTETYPYDLPTNWQLVERLPQLIGDFMWTAWDHLGEAGIGAWYYSDEQEASFEKAYPWLTSGAGAIDLIGNPTGEALWAKAVWEHDNSPYIAVRPMIKGNLVKSIWRGTNSIPSWSWTGCEGDTATVEVFTSAPSVRLYLNDMLLEEKTVIDKCASFRVCWQPGTLRAETADEQGNTLSSSLTSTEGKTLIALKPEKEDYRAGELIYVNVSLVGNNGEVVANRDQQLHVEVEGARLLAFGSANPCTTDRFKTGDYTTYYGQAQAILVSDNPGKVRLSVSGEKLKTKKMTIRIKK